MDEMGDGAEAPVVHVCRIDPWAFAFLSVIVHALPVIEPMARNHCPLLKICHGPRRSAPSPSRKVAEGSVGLVCNACRAGPLLLDCCDRRPQCGHASGSIGIRHRWWAGSP